jgi:hypothetical protein
MKNVDFYFWIVPQAPPKKPRRTRWRMTLEDGRAQFPQGEPDLSSKETRRLSEAEEERASRAHSNHSYAPKIDQGS